MAVRIVIIDGADRGREIKLTKDRFIIGRGADCDLVLPDDRISRAHAELSADGSGVWFISDSKSKNGVFVNGARIFKEPLRHGDVVQMGRARLLFSDDEQPSSAVPAGAVPEMHAPIEGKAASGDEPTDISPRIEGGRAAEAENLKTKLRALEQLSKTLNSSSTDLHSLLKQTMEIINQTFLMERGGVFMHDSKEKKYYSAIFQAREEENISFTPSVQKKLLERFSRKEHAFIDYSGEYCPEGDIGELSIIICAIKSRDFVWGFFYLESLKQTYIYSEDDLSTIEALSDQLAAAIEKSMLVKENREISARLANLEKHVSPEIARAIAESKRSILDDPFEAHEREVTILFSDIVDFTPLSERLPPSEVASLLNEYFARMVEAIIANGGTVNKFIGDAVMALFGAPKEHGNDTVNSVKAALAMMEALRRFHVQIDPKKRFDIRIGINTGNAVVGLIGSDKRMEYTVLGDTVNCASRIENLAPANKIAIGEATYMKIKDEFDCDLYGNVNVKGKSKAINVYIVKGPRLKP